MPTTDLVEKFAIRTALGNNGGQWATHYTEEQKDHWRQLVLELARDLHEETEALPQWQNLDHIIDVLEKAGCTKDGRVHAPEDVVANALRDWLRELYRNPPPA